jgi:hypothetical protein
MTPTTRPDRGTSGHSLLAATGITGCGATRNPDDELLEFTETVSSHPRRGIGVFKRDAEVGGEVGCFTDLALCSEGFRRGRRRTGNDVENALHVRAAEPGQEEPVIDRFAEASPFEVQQCRHASIAREPVAPVTVRVNRDDCPCMQRRALRYRRQAIEQMARHDCVPVQGSEVLNLGKERSLPDEPAVVKRFSPSVCSAWPAGIQLCSPSSRWTACSANRRAVTPSTPGMPMPGAAPGTRA